ncbi:MAG: type II toxin-antitoxin system VapB family antitoxin [Nitrospirae bacterium]|nr:type II toxin-antitoxin system VapB family antitoxin [Nitrospirota bacterium]MDA1303248.1 type II toxin-antitoxin system VapB family antitoxin [Nitrospirota bacterium]
MGRTNIELDDKLVKEGMKVFKYKTKKALVHLALEELLKKEKRKEILELRGKVKWEGNLEVLWFEGGNAMDVNLVDYH